MSTTIRIGVVMVMAVWLTPHDVVAQPVAVLAAIAKALKDGAVALETFENAIDKMITTGDRLFPVSEARRALRDLIAIKGKTGELIASKTSLVIGPIDDYIDLARSERIRDPQAISPSPAVTASWTGVTNNLSLVLDDVKKLLVRVKSQSDKGNLFVASPAYDTFLRTLSGRVSILEKLRALPPPFVSEELDALGRVRNEYVGLIRRLDEANSTLGRYIEEAAKPPRK